MTAQVAPKPLPGWNVLSISPLRAPDPTGRFVDGWTVTYQTASGVTGSVWVPGAQYTPENVQRLITADVALHNQVLALGS